MIQRRGNQLQKAGSMYLDHIPTSSEVPNCTNQPNKFLHALFFGRHGYTHVFVFMLVCVLMFLVGCAFPAHLRAHVVVLPSLMGLGASSAQSL